MFSFSKKTTVKLNLILDIKSSVVRGTLFLIKPAEIPYIVWTNTVEIPYKSGSDSAYLLNEAIKAVKKVAVEAHFYIHSVHLHEEIPKNISVIHMVLSSPWITSQARTINQKFNIDTKISRSHIHDMIQAERAKLISTDGLLVGIEEKIFDVRLNGYSVHKWEGNFAKTLETSFAISMASKRVTKGFVEACKEAGLHGARIDFHSSLLLQHIGLSKSLNIQDPYVLVHAHGELTDIVAANSQSCCVLFGSYPVGVGTIIRSLSSNLKISDLTADSTLTLYETKQLDQLHGASDIKAIVDATSSWTEGLSNILSVIPSNHQPLRAFISAHYHDGLFREIFNLAHPDIKIEMLPHDKVMDLVRFEPLVEKLTTTIFYITAVQILETF